MTQELIISTWVESADKFSVDFDQLWHFCGFSRKDAAKRTLELNFLKDVDYQTLHLIVEREIGATQKEGITLTVDAAKSFCMLAQTEKGKEVRKYFIECERKLKEVVKVPLTFREALLLAADQQAEIEKQQAQLKQAEPAIDYYNTISGKVGKDLKAVAAQIAYPKTKTTYFGQNDLFRALRDLKVFFRREGVNRVMQQYINNGCFYESEVEIKQRTAPTVVTVITATEKGICLIIKLLKKNPQTELELHDKWLKDASN